MFAASPSVPRRLSDARLQEGLRACLEHCGPIPGRNCHCPDFIRRCSIIAQFVKDSQHQAEPSLNLAPGGALSRQMPAEEHFINVLVLRRTGLPTADIGWIQEWRPDQLLHRLCCKALSGWCELPHQHCLHTVFCPHQAVAKYSMPSLGVLRIWALQRKKSLQRQVVSCFSDTPMPEASRLLCLLQALQWTVPYGAHAPEVCMRLKCCYWYPLLSALRSCHGHDFFFSGPMWQASTCSRSAWLTLIHGTGRCIAVSALGWGRAKARREWWACGEGRGRLDRGEDYGP